MNTVKSSQAISYVRIELFSRVLKTLSASIIWVDVMNDMPTHCVYTHVATLRVKWWQMEVLNKLQKDKKIV
jgi:hypothetical protein